MIRRVLGIACALLCAAPAFVPLAARADSSEAGAISAGLIEPSNAALKSALQQLQDGVTVAQANPVGTPQAPIHRPSLPQGFTYNVDVSVAWPLSNVGFNAKDPGGVDAGFGYSFSRTNRLTVGYYEIQQVPVGFSNKNVPFYLQGYTGPGTNLPGASLGSTNTGVVDVVTKDKIFQVGDQNLFLIAGKLPIVITPTYLAHWATIGGQSDVSLAEYNGFATTVHQRTEQEYLLPVTLPFLSTPRMFATITAAPQWLVHTAGFNQSNHAQLFVLGYVEYRLDRKTTVYFQPSRLIAYDPPNPWPQYTPSFIYGASHRFTKWTYIQGTVLEGGATNYNGNWGIVSLTCQRLPCNPNQVAPQFSGLHAAELQLQFGVGSPTVIPL